MILYLPMSVLNQDSADKDEGLRFKSEYTLNPLGSGVMSSFNRLLIVYFQDTSNASKNVMIFFDDSTDQFRNSIHPCTTVDECLDICQTHPDACSAPVDITRVLRDGIWSREADNSPFADYFKVIMK
jgi:hypothetical protein